MEESMYNMGMKTRLTQKTVKDWMMTLSCSKGYYGRLLYDFTHADAVQRRDFMKNLTIAKVRDILSFVEYCEG